MIYMGYTRDPFWIPQKDLVHWGWRKSTGNDIFWQEMDIFAQEVPFLCWDCGKWPRTVHLHNKRQGRPARRRPVVACKIVLHRDIPTVPCLNKWLCFNIDCLDISWQKGEAWLTLRTNLMPWRGILDLPLVRFEAVWLWGRQCLGHPRSKWVGRGLEMNSCTSEQLGSMGSGA